MGLAERRAIKHFQDNTYPPLLKQIQDAAGFAVTVEVDWESLATLESSHLYEECLPKVYFLPVVDGMARIAIDDMGKEALKSAVKKIVIQNKKPDYSSYWATFEHGVLTLDHQLSNVDYGKDRADELVRILESKL
jgi:hypothetical protein